MGRIKVLIKSRNRKVRSADVWPLHNTVIDRRTQCLLNRYAGDATEL